MDTTVGQGLYPLHRCKTLHLVRHAQGIHNVKGEKNHNAYLDLFDAHLTPLGWKQVDDLRKHVQASGISKRIDLVITSPLLRLEELECSSINQLVDMVLSPPQGMVPPGWEKNDLLIFFATLFYKVWSFRNRKLHEGYFNLSRAVMEINWAVEEFTGFQSRVADNSEETLPAETVLKWEPPAHGWLKINVDAATKNVGCAISMVVRSDLGELVFLASKVIEGEWTSSFGVEVEALAWASDYAEVCGWVNIDFEMDAKEVVETILMDEEPGNRFSLDTLMTIRRRFAKHTWNLSWKPRETNAVADLTAKFSLTNHVSFFIDEYSVEELPSSLVDCLRMDKVAAGLTMQTAVGVFGGEAYTDGIEVPPLMVANAGKSDHSAISSLNCPPFMAIELCREHLGVLSCHKRRSISEYRHLFPAIDFSLIESDDDILWMPDIGEKNEDVAARGQKFLNWLWTRKEEEIAVVTHGAFLYHTLSAFGNDCHPSVKSEICSQIRHFSTYSNAGFSFANCELRSVVIVDWSLIGSDSSSTNYPGKIPDGLDLRSDFADEKHPEKIANN
ncbi:hypothetical protein FNV43_RR12636 [Rhamnella rubrinervis]|uniref:RNase H type-1 domain-containing protein n=1 Tax=Rhamnella rubrinervis TaxID=2594499 RepID=A0A8K0H8P0_9ROSA|nr:hypothetical protein FNV43_RR12636 [Rhamnella rubrinervis]